MHESQLVIASVRPDAPASWQSLCTPMIDDSAGLLPPGERERERQRERERERGREEGKEGVRESREGGRQGD